MINKIHPFEIHPYLIPPRFHEPINWLFDTGGSASGGPGSVARAGRASRAGTRAGRIVRLIRLVRLLRVVNIAKLFQSTKKSELDEQQTSAAKDDKAGDRTKRVEASRLGKILSEQTTRTVIIGVLDLMRLLGYVDYD